MSIEGARLAASKLQRGDHGVRRFLARDARQQRGERLQVAGQDGAAGARRHHAMQVELARHQRIERMARNEDRQHIAFAMQRARLREIAHQQLALGPTLVRRPLASRCMGVRRLVQVQHIVVELVGGDACGAAREGLRVVVAPHDHHAAEVPAGRAGAPVLRHPVGRHADVERRAHAIAPARESLLRRALPRLEAFRGKQQFVVGQEGHARLRMVQAAGHAAAGAP